MTHDKLRSLFQFYSAHLARVDPHTGCPPINRDRPGGTMRNHLRWICEEAANDLVPAGRIEKAMRWLGFVQGVLYCFNDFTIDELKDHSKPDSAADAGTVAAEGTGP